MTNLDDIFILISHETNSRLNKPVGKANLAFVKKLWDNYMKKKL